MVLLAAFLTAVRKFGEKRLKQGRVHFGSRFEGSIDHGGEVIVGVPAPPHLWSGSRASGLACPTEGAAHVYIHSQRRERSPEPLPLLLGSYLGKDVNSASL